MELCQEWWKEHTPSNLGWGLPRWCSGKDSGCQCRRRRTCRFYPWVGKIPWGRKWQPTLVFLPGKFHEQRSLEGYSPWGHEELDMTEQLSTHMLCMTSKHLINSLKKRIKFDTVAKWTTRQDSSTGWFALPHRVLMWPELSWGCQWKYPHFLTFNLVVS